MRRERRSCMPSRNQQLKVAPVVLNVLGRAHIAQRVENNALHAPRSHQTKVPQPHRYGLARIVLPVHSSYFDPMHPRPLAGLVALVFSLAPLARGGEPAAPAKLGSAVYSFDRLVAKPTGAGLSRRVVDGPTATFARFESHVTTLNAGNISHPPHRHPQEEFILLREGTLDVFIDGKVQRAGPGSLVFFASNHLHNVTNIGDSPATYIVFNLTTEATARVSSTPAAEAAGGSALESSVFVWDRLTAKPTKTGERRDIVNSPTATWANFEAHATTLRAGEVPHAPHRHPDEEIIVVKEGTMAATLNGRTERGGPGSIFFFASNEEHGLKNVGDAPATYYVIRIVTAATPRGAKEN